MNAITTIKLGIGLGDLPFGATRDAVTAYLGHPDGTESHGDPGNAKIMWYYSSIAGYVSFDEDDGFRLGTIETASQSASLNGQCLIGLPKQEVLEFLTGLPLGEPEEQVNDLEDDGDSRSCLLSFSSQSLNLWFEDDVLTEIQWGYLIDENGQVIWPEDSEPGDARERENACTKWSVNSPPRDP